MFVYKGTETQEVCSRVGMERVRLGKGVVSVGVQVVH